ncbi:response regulator transcription factor [Brevibacillus sp. Leaf182]|uniref:response regulator transcription factor n=1 Tax=Brevibacillus sp. Leaf182 TaxID=1736290 RepID=UPI0006F2C66C|nr:response regulator transcription factor [Brevibacillus sp. Leaf182]RAT95335.1 response regulator [Brevibacillus sp. Leaf182]
MSQIAKAYSFPLFQAFEHVLTFYESSQLPCGIILAVTNGSSEEKIQDLKISLAKAEGFTDIHCFYDKQSSILGILLGDQMLGNTHFHSLFIKEQLQTQRMLAGPVFIASFPEQGESAAQVLSGMVQEITAGMGSAGDIHIYSGKRSSEIKGSLLLVSQDETVNEFLRIYLQRKGYCVYLADNGREAWEKYKRFLPDAVITDINLAIEDGYQLISKINGVEHGTKIVVLTHKRLEDDKKRSFELGVSDYIAKPFSPVDLEARVRSLLS